MLHHLCLHIEISIRRATFGTAAIQLKDDDHRAKADHEPFQNNCMYPAIPHVFTGIARTDGLTPKATKKIIRRS